MTDKSEAQTAVAPAVDRQLVAELVARAQADGMAISGEGGLLAQSHHEGQVVGYRRRPTRPSTHQPMSTVATARWHPADHNQRSWERRAGTHRAQCVLDGHTVGAWQLTTLTTSGVTWQPG